MAVKGWFGRLVDLSHFVRITQLPFLVRRAAGFSAVQHEAFQIVNDPAIQSALPRIAHQIRGENHRPAIFVHGVLPRSGTNYLADAVALHPHIVQNPGELWEFPLLYMASGADALQQEFQFMFPPNRQVMHRYEMLAYLAGGWMRVLQDGAGDRRMLFKSPHMQNLALFSALFPHDKLLILVRDGRDVLQSSLATFGYRLFGKSFSAMASEWSAATALALEFQPGGRLASDNIQVVRYEDLVRDGRSVMEQVLRHCGLASEAFDWSQFDALPVRGSSTNNAAMAEKWRQVPRDHAFNPLGRWRAWPHARKAAFKKRAGETLIAAGYAQDLDW
jgi:protein-tyrosine sulfotransferase